MKQATIISNGSAKGTSIRVDGEILKNISSASYSLKTYGNGIRVFSFSAQLGPAQ